MSEDWIARHRAGDPAAFECMVRALTPTIYKLAFTLMGNEHDAKDAVQETFIKVFHALPQFRGDSSVQTWVYRIASNTCKDMLRALGRFQVVSPDDEDVFLQIPDSSPTPEDKVVIKEKQALVRTAIDALPTDYKLAILLCDIKGLSYIEAAQSIGCPLGTLKSRLARARSLLLKDLSKKRELFSDDERQRIEKEAPNA